MQTHQDICFSVSNDDEHIYFNTRDFTSPVLQFIPYPIKVNGIAFPDGTFLTSATGGGGSPPALVAGTGITLTSDVGTVTISTDAAAQTPWMSNIDGANFSLSNVISITSANIYNSWMELIDANNASASHMALSQRNGQVQIQEVGVWDVLFAVTKTGFVGINNASPAYALDVAGDCNIGAGSAYRINGVAISTSQTPWTQDINAAGYNLTGCGGIACGVFGAGNWTGVEVSSNNSTSSVGFELYISAGSLNGYLQLYGSTHSWGAPYAGNLQLQCQSGGILITTGSNLSSLITAAGLWGIGKTNPAYKCDIAGDCNITGTYRINGVPLATGAAQTPWTSDIQGDNFGLQGTRFIAVGSASLPASPQVGLSMIGNQGLLSVYIANTGGDAALSLNNQTAQTSLTYSGTTLYIQNTATTPNAKFSFQGDGVGIKISNPQYALDVAGDINLTGTIYGAAPSGLLFSIPTTGAQVFTFNNNIVVQANYINLTGASAQYSVRGNFAPAAMVSATAPPTDINEGTLWFNTANSVLNVLHNGAWIPV